MIITRRKALAVLGISGFATLGCLGRAKETPSGTASSDQYPDPVAADAWIESSGLLHAAKGALRLGRFSDRVYFITDEINWTPNSGQEAHKPVEVPKGFVTDFASIPRAFWALLPPDGTYAYAAIIHDYLYWFQPRSREESDLIFNFAMSDFKIGALTRNLIYDAVRAVGGLAWRANAKLRESGERRVLRRFPDDPTMTWSEWKKQPNVFLT